MIKLSTNTRLFHSVKLDFSGIEGKYGNILLLVEVHAHWVNLVRAVCLSHFLVSLLVGRIGLFLFLKLSVLRVAMLVPFVDHFRHRVVVLAQPIL